MKFNEETMQQAMVKYIEDPFWRNIYEGASETAKKRLRVAFWASKYLDEKEDRDAYREYRESVECEMTYEDAAYLAKEFPDCPGKKHYERMRDRLEMAAMKTKEKLDAATEVLIAEWRDCDREMVARTQRLLRQCDEPWVKYEWIWGAVGGNGDDCEWLGDTFDHGHGVKPDSELAYFWFRRGSFCGHGDSCARLAAVYEDEGPRFDMGKSKFWFAEALRRNSVNAKIDIGARLTTWEEGPWTQCRNPKVGLKLLKSAADQGDNKRANYFIGKCYEQGVGVERNLQEALFHYEAAAEGEIWGADEAVERVLKLLNEGNGDDWQASFRPTRT